MAVRPSQAPHQGCLLLSQVHVLGKSETHDLEVPDDLHHIAQVDANLNFTEYYKHIYYTNAVLLYLSSDSYIIDRWGTAGGTAGPGDNCWIGNAVHACLQACRRCWRVDAQHGHPPH